MLRNAEKTAVSKTSGIVLSMFLGFIFLWSGFLLQAHGHADLTRHNTCILCNAQNMAIENNDVTVIIDSTPVFVCTLLFPFITPSPCLRSDYPTRAPPDRFFL
ncbi:MAG: hypothetical protein MUF22_02335 [Chitinispirillaceae bacterium]|jgi:hypothetical protein|nr:hypothetical protein [Chitinispirillaceae bacterium]